MIKTYSQNENLSELEIETITNFLVKESISIIDEEVDYFFLSRENLIETILEGVSLDNMDLRGLRNKLNKVLYTKEDVAVLVQKIEKRIRKEIQMAQWENNFRFNLNQIAWLEPGYAIPSLHEEMKTLLYSSTMAKAVDMAWIKLRKQMVPAAFNKLVSKVKAGNLVLAAVQADPRRLKDDLNARVIKLVRGSLKQYKTRLCRDLASQVCNQLFNIQKFSYSDSVKLIKVQTA